MRVDELQGEHRSTSSVKNVFGKKIDKIYIHETAEHLYIVLTWRSHNTATISNPADKSLSILLGFFSIKRFK